MVGMMFGLIYDEARKIWCYRWLAVITTALIFSLAALKILSMSPVYDAWGQVFVNDKNPVAVATRGVSLDKDEDNLIERTILNDNSLERVVFKTDPNAKNLTQAELMGAIGSLRSKISVQ